MKEEETALAGSVGLSIAGIAATGTAGLAFLTDPVEVPLWFPVAAVALPTGDVLKVLRSRIKAYGKTQK